MFHKYDFGTASQMNSLRMLDNPPEPQETGLRRPLTISIIVIEVCAIFVLCLMPHSMKSSAVGKQSHKASTHTHTFRHTA